MEASKGLASGPRDVVAVSLFWAAAVAGLDAFSFSRSRDHFDSGYQFAFDLVPWQMMVGFFSVFSIMALIGGLRILLRRHVSILLLNIGLGFWSLSSGLMGIALIDSAGWPAGMTGAMKWFSCSVGAGVASVIAVHSDRRKLNERIDQVFEWISEDFTITKDDRT